jgi:CRP/FNR family transcriptional regulator, anaerobic regulatory protein
MTSGASQSAMTTACANCPLRGVPIFNEGTPLDASVVQAFKIGELTVAPAGTILLEHARASHLFTVLSGWTFRYKTFEDGRRQIINYALPGDFLGLQASMSEVMGHGIEALTDCVLCVFPRDKLWGFFANDAQLAYDITWLAASQERTLDEQIVSLGRRTALERVAYLLWYLFDKARGLGMARRNRIDLPTRQSHLADTLGLSVVHTNKTLQKLRKQGSIELDDRILRIIDEDALKTLARVDEIQNIPRPLI